MGAALSEALMPVWREPVTMTSSKSLSVEVGVSANNCVVGNAAAAQSSATVPRNLSDRARSSHRGKELRASLLAMSIWHPFMFVVGRRCAFASCKTPLPDYLGAISGPRLRSVVGTARKPAKQRGFMPVRLCIS
jgi:hypothetical protein